MTTTEPKAARQRPPAPAAAIEQIQRVPVELLRESPTNRRRTWGNLEELATSIRHVGVLEPLCARRIVEGTQQNHKVDVLELVFGHRRLRAAKAAGVADVPVIVRDLSDAQAIEIQAVENLQRTDLHPLEEAEGFEQLLALGWSADDVAAKLGKSKAYVYARLQLLKLVPEARDAFYAERLTASVALEVARVPPSMQLEALQLLEEEAESVDYTWNEKKGGRPDPLATREAADLLRGRYTLRLIGAPFDRQDAQLVPAAGACTTCPKRSGAQPELFGDVGSPDVCTDPTCFDTKRIAATTKARERLEAKGVTVVDGRRAHGHTEAPAGFVTADASEWVNGRPIKIADLVKKKTVAKKLGARVVMLGDNGKPVDLYKKAEVLGAAGIKSASRSSSSYKPPSPEQLQREGQKRDAARAAEVLAIEKTLAALEQLKVGVPLLQAARVAVRSVPTWKLRDVVERRGWKGGVDANAKKLNLVQLLGVLVEACVEDIAPLALHFKVDVKALEKAELEKRKAAEKAKAEKTPTKKDSTKGRKK